MMWSNKRKKMKTLKISKPLDTQKIDTSFDTHFASLEIIKFFYQISTNIQYFYIFGFYKIFHWTYNSKVISGVQVTWITLYLIEPNLTATTNAYAAIVN